MQQYFHPVLPAPPPPPDGGFPADDDLSQMSDDGCPLGPDPTRWSDADWRDAADPPAGAGPVVLVPVRVWS